ncbi:MBL fold metallo-hydrolase [Rhizobium bangladeshense]|uniref:MBL fold metallo-hydrolase n=1 Tax=Rhizobium bangladeshense TaxID=1138189 RepID=A0ABS7LJP3_9HYPH|nr:MBL fold metallo-hydrolase [Rhizobium bangladeshense]MBY3591384.1 MBL fold metallo-hydrolase [Rhizobium bangladeshense]
MTSVANSQPVSRRSLLTGALATFAVAPFLTSNSLAKSGTIVDSLRDAAAHADVTTYPTRGNISVLEGSGGNIAVLTGKQGKILVDAGITATRARIEQALSTLGDQPVTHLINTHWHFDHTDGNEWLHSVGAAIIAHENTRRHLLEAQRVDDWNFDFPPSPAGAIPATLITNDKVLELEGTKFAITSYQPAHTDSDISVYFEEANVIHVGDIFWSGLYPFIDYSTGGSIDGTIAASAKVIAAVDADTVIIPGHGKPISTLDDLKHYHEMLATIRDNVARLKTAGRSVDEAVAAKPTEAFDDQWGKAIISPAFFTRLVYKGV